MIFFTLSVYMLTIVSLNYVYVVGREKEITQLLD